MTQRETVPEQTAQTVRTAQAGGREDPEKPVIVFDHVFKSFDTQGGNAVRAVDDVSLSIRPGDVFGVIGYSGAGKSTLVRMINALERPTSGTVRVLGTDITHLSESKLRPIRQKIGMIFQQFNLFAMKTVAQNVAYPLELDHWRHDYRDRRVSELLKFVGLEQHARKYPAQLSGGQKQRVGIARALATNPRILLADEATSALDPQTTRDVLALLQEVNRRFGVTIVIITHQMSVVQEIANRVAVMSKGRIVEQGSVYDVFAAPQREMTRRFTATSMHDLPDAERVQRLHREHAGRLVTMIIRGRGVRAQGRTVPASGGGVTTLIAGRGIGSTLVYGGVDTVGGSAVGGLTFELTGDDGRIDALLADIAANTEVIDFGTAEHPTPYERAVGGAGQKVRAGDDERRAL